MHFKNVKGLTCFALMSIVLVVFIRISGAGELKTLTVDDINVNTSEYEKILDGIQVDIDPEMLKKAKESIPDDLNERVQKEVDRLWREKFIEAGKVIEHNQKVQNREDVPSSSPLLREDERVYVFISSSVPVETLENYAFSIDRLGIQNVSMVMRGFVGGMKEIGPTVEFVRKIILKDPECVPDCEAYKVNVVIDPFLFRRYKIEKVPAIVYTKGVRILDYFSSEGLMESANVSDYYILYGDMAFDGALERINATAKARSLDCVVHKLRRGEVSKRFCEP